ncbi:ABC transporter permease [Undibacterium flavidum]|uniref:FtsX-like permease family protein n=1 Tax=Undibacterium flavidum TaxID=2762297 RepID=A0ABR6Y652_9BURK|nr:FtsX-like permease family protein [Undibacterium flavidum]MBC3872091.1 FtsX-like permease family protein [Undibacterium flavidum]
MLQHLLRQFWHRKFKNILLSAEILLAFLLVFAVLAMTLRYLQLAQLPMGFSYQDVWTVEVLARDKGTVENDPVFYEKLKQGLSVLPEIEQLAFVSSAPYTPYSWRTNFYLANSSAIHKVYSLFAGDHIFDTLNMKLLAGRWYSEVDEGKTERAIVITAQTARNLFPGHINLGDVIGNIVSDDGSDLEKRSQLKIVGIVSDFRLHGELEAPENFAFMRFSPLSSERGVAVLLLKLRPGTPRNFEAKLNQQLRLIQSKFGSRIETLSDLRQTKLQEDITPLIAAAVIAVFMLLMVVFGLFGVLWQNTTRRIPELGLRRAVGASSGSIYRQILSEQFILTSSALIIGLLILVQLPITGTFGDDLDWPLFGLASVLAMVVIYGLTIICALYPAWRASRMSPTQALHYE